MKNHVKKFLAAFSAVLLLAAGGAYAADVDDNPLDDYDDTYYEGTYDDDYGDDWYYDRYRDDDFPIDDNDVRGYLGEEDRPWYDEEEYYRGYYDDEDPGDDWWYDQYEAYDTFEEGVENERIPGEPFWDLDL